MKHRQFTLLELLTVIFIIIVLTGILIPTVSTVLGKVKEKKALSMISTLKMAIKAYEADYGFMPFTGRGSDSQISGSSYDLLLSTLEGNTASQNPREIKYLDLTNSGSDYLDPWGHDFRVVLDLDYDNSVIASLIEGRSANLNTSIVIWSMGEDGNEGTDSANEDNINSWVD